MELKETVKEVGSAILPVTIIVLVLSVALFRLETSMILRFMTGIAMVGAGFVLFLYGVRIGLFPMGEAIGAELPKRGSLWFIILFGFILGFAVTIAEPDVQVLSGMINSVSGGLIPKTDLLIAISIGVAVFVALAMAKVFLAIRLEYLLLAGYGIAFLLAIVTPASFIPISFDAGGVTTGPMTVPFILALGAGVTAVVGSRANTDGGFGFIALASIGPLIAMMLLGGMYG